MFELNSLRQVFAFFVCAAVCCFHAYASTNADTNSMAVSDELGSSTSNSLISNAFASKTLPGNAVSKSNLVFQGKAFSLDSDQLLYTEHHTIQLDNEGRYLAGMVEYKRPTGERIAYKTLDFSQTPFVPDVYFVDERNQENTVLSVTDGQLVIERGDQSRIKREEVEIDQLGKIVADAGFDRFVLANWSKLVSGESVDFDVLALSRATLIGFTLRKTGESGQLLKLEIKPSNWFIRMLMDPIDLRYDLSLKRLQEYRGLTNIPAEQDGELIDENYRARIVYQYAND